MTDRTGQNDPTQPRQLSQAQPARPNPLTQLTDGIEGRPRPNPVAKWRARRPDGRTVANYWAQWPNWRTQLIEPSDVEWGPRPRRTDPLDEGNDRPVDGRTSPVDPAESRQYDPVDPVIELKDGQWRCSWCDGWPSWWPNDPGPAQWLWLARQPSWSPDWPSWRAKLTEPMIGQPRPMTMTHYWPMTMTDPTILIIGGDGRTADNYWPGEEIGDLLLTTDGSQWQWPWRTQPNCGPIEAGNY